MTCLTGMHKKSGGAGACEGRRNLATNKPRLAHSGHDHTAWARQQRLTSLRKLLVKACSQRRECLAFAGDYCAGVG